MKSEGAKADELYVMLQKTPKPFLYPLLRHLVKQILAPNSLSVKPVLEKI